MFPMIKEVYKLSNQQFQEILSLSLVAYKSLHFFKKLKLLKNINLIFQSRVGDLEQIQLELSRLRNGDLSDFRPNLLFSTIVSSPQNCRHTLVVNASRGFNKLCSP
jgi:hypothetical protein